MTDRFNWLNDFQERLKRENVLVEETPAPTLAPARVLRVDVEDWGKLAREAKRFDCRWSATWAEDRDDHFLISVCLEKQGAYLLVRTRLEAGTPVLPSHTPYYPAADRAERHMQDLFGIAFSDHPDARRWTRHRAWKAGEYPLRRRHPAAGLPPPETPPDHDYQFLYAHGSGVYEIPVGPVHAGIIEPGHFRFQAVGETVLNLEERLGYVHKGVEKIAEGRDPAGLARLAARVSGDSTVAHGWAACMAMERAAGIEPPPRAAFLRAILAERERIANHLGDIGAILNDVAFSFGFYQFGRLRELWQRQSAAAFGHRFMMDVVVPGGVARDLEHAGARAMLDQIASLRREFAALMPIFDSTPSLEDRLVTTGVLSTAIAAQLGCVGYVGRASGLAFDVRAHAPYAPYDRLTIDVPVFTAGDVAARVAVRAHEIRVSLHLIEELLHNLPEGRIAAPWQPPAADADGLGMVDGWRGETVAYVRFGANNTIARYYPRDPSWLTWPALEYLIHDNIVPDFPVCNKSVNGSYSGHDL